MKYLFGFFERSVGAAADVRELEYISGLHQVAIPLRRDGTISAKDVRVFLRSRHGLVLHKEDSIDIVKGLSGTARLPLPKIKRSKFRRLFARSKKPETIPEDVEVGNPDESAQKRRCWKICARSNKDDDEEVEEEALFEVADQWKSMRRSKLDIRKNWNHVDERTPKPKVSASVEELVRYDLVDMMSLLMIPSFLRLERKRFGPPPQPPPPYEGILRFRNVWHYAKFSHYVINLPFIVMQRWRHRRMVALKESLRPRDTLLLDVLKLMLASLENDGRSITQSELVNLSLNMGDSTTTRGSYMPELKKTIVSEELVRNLLERYGQVADANDDQLVRDMVEAAGGEGAIMNERAFARALTVDVNRWPVECEDDITTTFYDVYGFSPTDCNKYAKTITPEDLLRGFKEDSPWAHGTTYPKKRSTYPRQDSLNSFYSAEEVERARSVADSEQSLRPGKIPAFRKTASYIDYSADTFRSLWFVAALFIFYIMASVFIMLFINSMGISTLDCSSDWSDFGCKLLQTCWSWLTLAVILSLGGIVIIAPISLGNHQYVKSGKLVVVSLSFLLFVGSVPALETFLFDYLGVPPPENWEEDREKTGYDGVLFIFWGAGAVTFFEILRGLVGGIIPKALVRRFHLLRVFFLPSDIRRTATLKRAGTYKINAVLENAHKIHRRARKKAKGRNADDETMLTFVLHGERKVDCGGFWWTWWNTLCTRNLIKKEGIWIQSKLMVGVVAQLIVSAFLVFLWVLGTKTLADSAQAKRDEVIEEDSIWTETLLRWIPEPWMIHYSFYPGGIITFLMVILLISVYYPSTVSTILKHRSGFSKALGENQFETFRKFAGYTYYNLGNMIYALIGSAGLFFIIFAGALFLIYWPISQEFMVLVIAWGFGLGITCGAKMALTMCCRSRAQSALYRKRPNEANYASLALEAWHIGLGGGVMLGRLCQILLAAAFWIGRVDTPFLATGVEVFGYKFDTVSQFYVADTMMHEAHRHPFMERLSSMYLMRLKYGENFGSDAGAAWRNLFVLSLMPWLLKHRAAVDKDDEEDDDDDEEEFFPLEESRPEEHPTIENVVRFEGNVPWMETDVEEEDPLPMNGEIPRMSVVGDPLLEDGDCSKTTSAPEEKNMRASAGFHESFTSCSECV